jgi:hypothetical protein
MPCSALSMDSSHRRRDSLAPLDPDWKQDDSASSQTKPPSLRNINRLVSDQYECMGSAMRSPSLVHNHLYSPDQIDSIMSAAIPCVPLAQVPYSPLPNIRTCVRSPTLDLGTSDHIHSASNRQGYDDTQYGSYMQHIPYPHPHPPHVYDPAVMPRSAPPGPSNKHGRSKTRKKKDKPRNRKKRVKAGAANIGSGDVRPVRRKQRMRETCPTTTWNPATDKTANRTCPEQKQSDGKCQSFEEYILDTRRNCAKTRQNPPLLSRSTSSVAFIGPGYVLSPSGGNVLSPRFSVET